MWACRHYAAVSWSAQLDVSRHPFVAFMLHDVHFFQQLWCQCLEDVSQGFVVGKSASAQHAHVIFDRHKPSP